MGKPNPEDMKPTIGVDFEFTKVQRVVNGTSEQVMVTLWDTAGQERFRTITPHCYNGAQGIIVCYDITNRATYEGVDSWVNELRMHGADNVVTCLVGNKFDLVEAEPEKRRVSTVEAEELAKKFSMDYFHETSAFTGKNVKDVFFDIVDVVLTRQLQDEKEAKARLASTSEIEEAAVSGDAALPAEDVALEEGARWMHADARLLPLPGMAALASINPLRWERTPCLIDLAQRFEELAEKTPLEDQHPVRLRFAGTRSNKKIEKEFCDPAEAAQWIRACQRVQLLPK